MAEELTPEELEHARLYEQEIKSIEKNLLEVLDGSNLLQPSINRILTLSRERNIQIDSRLWEMLVSSNYNYHFCDRQVTETIANNPNPSIKATIFECIHEEIYLDTKQISKSNYKNNLFESLIGSTNPNFPHNLLDKLLQKTIEGLKGRDLEYIDKEQTFNIFSTY